MLEIYKDILKKEGLTGVDMCAFFGLTYGSYRYATKSSAKESPRWVRAFVVGYELGLFSGKGVSEKKNCDAPHQ